MDKYLLARILRAPSSRIHCRAIRQTVVVVHYCATPPAWATIKPAFA